MAFSGHLASSSGSVRSRTGTFLSVRVSDIAICSSLRNTQCLDTYLYPGQAFENFVSLTSSTLNTTYHYLQPSIYYYKTTALTNIHQQPSTIIFPTFVGLSLLLPNRPPSSTMSSYAIASPSANWHESLNNNEF